MADLSAVVVVGCCCLFTGLRVGMATAAAYGHALGIPVHGVSSIDAIAAGTDGDVVITDARRREVYWARYHDAVRVDGPHVSSPADAPNAQCRIEFAHRHTGGACRRSDGWLRTGSIVPMYLRRPDAEDTGRAWTAVKPQPDLVYDRLTRADAARCAELEMLLFGGDDPWPEQAFVRELAATHNHVAARLDGTLIGYAGIARLGRTPPFEYEIQDTIGVDPVDQGRGIGMMAELLDFAGADDGLPRGAHRQRPAAIALYSSPQNPKTP